MCEAHEFDQKKKLISKNLHHVLKLQDRQLICSQPPETVRDHLIAAARALRVGDWSSTLKLIFADKMNAKIWNLFTPYGTRLDIPFLFYLGQLSYIDDFYEFIF